MKKSTFYLLSFTWGLPITLIGCIISLVLLIAGKKPKKWGYCWYFEVGNHWGGWEIGPVFLVDKMSCTSTKNHEFGHGLQNCYLGPLFPFLVWIPSAYRYWLRNFAVSKMKNFAWVVYAVALAIGSILIGLAYHFELLWLFIIAFIFVGYFTILHVWSIGFEIPKYGPGKYPMYDDFWAEGQATKWGTEMMKKLGENE